MIVGHKIQREFLKKSFESSRISHAYLFSGVDGLGKKTVALEFVKLINRAVARGEDGRRNKFLLPSRLRLDERSSSTIHLFTCSLEHLST